MDARDETVTGGRMVTRELAAWVAGLRYEDLPDPVVTEAGRAFADFLGESLFVGATKPWGQAIAEFCADEGGGQPQATIIATGKKTLASRAALANGTMALGFEYADFGGGGRPYPFAVTAPLALAEARATAGAGSRARDRHRLRGDGPGDGRDPPAGAAAERLLPPGAVRHVRVGSRRGAGARALRRAHELRPRARRRVHRVAPSRVTRKARGSAR